MSYSQLFAFPTMELSSVNSFAEIHKAACYNRYTYKLISNSRRPFFFLRFCHVSERLPPISPVRCLKASRAPHGLLSWLIEKMNGERLVRKRTVALSQALDPANAEGHESIESLKSGDDRGLLCCVRKAAWPQRSVESRAPSVSKKLAHPQRTPSSQQLLLILLTA